MRFFKTALLAALPLFIVYQSAFAAQLSPTATLDTEVRMQGADTDNGDLGTTGSKSTAVGATEAKFKFTDTFNDNALFYWEGRAVGAVGRGGVEDVDTGSISNTGSFLEWRQSYFQFGNIGAPQGNVRIGRQRVNDQYGLWWNQDFDAVRYTYDTTLFKGSLVGGQNLFSYRTGPGDFSENDKDLARVMAEGSWQYYYQHFFETRLMYQDDHSGLSVGDTQNPDDPDDGTGQLVWGGVRATGKTAAFGETDKLFYRVDLLGVTGHEHTPTVGGGLVTAVDGRNVSGWAFDASTDIPLPNMAPLVHLGYAYGSGDGDPASGTDHAFRQSGMSGNFSRFGALSQNTDNYGTVLRPELANIHIISAGVTMPVLTASDAGVIYRYYRLADAAASINSNGVLNTLNGVDKSLGQGVDFVFNMDVSKEQALNFNNVQDIALRSSLGFFRSGDAFGTADGETAVRGLVEVKVSF